MKQKYEPRKRKPIKEVQTTKDFSGEASPYWDFMEKTCNRQNRTSDNTLQEDPLANPDVLAEDDTLYHRPLSEDGELRLEAVRQTIASLSPQQKRVLHLCGELGYTQEMAASAMSVSESAVHTYLDRARKKIERCYERLKSADER